MSKISRHNMREDERATSDWKSGNIARRIIKDLAYN